MVRGDVQQQDAECLVMGIEVLEVELAGEAVDDEFVEDVSDESDVLGGGFRGFCFEGFPEGDAAVVAAGVEGGGDVRDIGEDLHE